MNLLRQGWVTSADGTRLATYEAGPRDAPVLLLVNGLGGNIAAWRGLVERFAGRFRIVSWDYRGLFRSFGPPGGDFALPRHCDDLDAVLADLEVDRAVVLGWSMGVQVALEAYRRRPSLFRGLVLIDGTWGRPLTTGFTADWMRQVGPAWLEVLRRAGPVLSTVGPPALRSGLFFLAARSLGLVSPTLDEDAALEVTQDFCRLDMDAFVRTFQGMDAHDAEAVLGTVTVPTLVIGGDRDLFTPPDLARRMAEAIRGAELFIVRGGSHYVPLEYPAALNQRLEKFLRERVAAPEGTVAVSPRPGRTTRPAGGGRRRKA